MIGDGSAIRTSMDLFADLPTLRTITAVAGVAPCENAHESTACCFISECRAQ